MAGTIQSQYSVLMQADGDGTAFAASGIPATTGSRATTYRMPVTMTPAQIDVGSCATLGLVAIKNLSGADVKVWQDAGATILFGIAKAGGSPMVMPFPGAAPYVSTAASTAEIKVFVGEV